MHGLADKFDVRDAALHEGNFAADFCEVILFAGREVVEHNHAVAAPHEFVYCIRANKTRAARDEISHSGIPPRSRSVGGGVPSRSLMRRPAKTRASRFGNLEVRG